MSWKDCATVGNLLGTRLVLNEFVAFLQLGPLKEQLDPRSFVIATYALCGFANFSSIAIQIGGIGALAPTRKSDLARLGLSAVAAGTMANFMSACIAGMLLVMYQRNSPASFRARLPLAADVAVVLGSGLGGSPTRFRSRLEIPYADIPRWPPSTAIGHAGKFVYGTIGRVPVLALAGRAHLYEGYTPEQVVFGVRVSSLLGVKSLVITNAAGGINLEFERGGFSSDFRSHQSARPNPLVGPNDDGFGPRFPDMWRHIRDSLRAIA